MADDVEDNWLFCSIKNKNDARTRRDSGKIETMKEEKYIEENELKKFIFPYSWLSVSSFSVSGNIYAYRPKINDYRIANTVKFTPTPWP